MMMMMMMMTTTMKMMMITFTFIAPYCCPMALYNNN